MLVRWESDDGDQLDVKIQLLSVSPSGKEREFIEVVPYETELTNSKVPGEPFAEYQIRSVFAPTKNHGRRGGIEQRLPRCRLLAFRHIINRMWYVLVLSEAHFISPRAVNLSTFCACTWTVRCLQRAWTTSW